MQKSIITVFSLAFLLLTISACKGDNKETTDSSSEQKTDSTQVVPKEFQINEVLYAWVDRLNIRQTPSTKGKTVAAVQNNEPLEFTGEKSDQNETIVLRGVAYNEPWLKVITKDKTEGWVFGGAVKKEDEPKGNAILDENNFDFPCFGRFDLNNWKKQSSNDESGGDAEIFTTVYQKGNRILEITKSDVGEYGYSRDYKLTDAKGKTLKIRTLAFNVDPELILTETVLDYTSIPGKEYTRSQKMNKHFFQLNALPEMVNGAWKVSDLEGGVIQN